MQLDQTRIAIRERSFGDILDLALRVVRAHAPALCVTWLLGAIPAAAFNIWFFGSRVREHIGSGMTEEQLAAEVIGSGFLMALFLIMQAPWASMLTTLYLGQALFVEQPKPRQILHEAWRSLPQMALFQLAIRAFLTPWVVTWPVLFGMWPFLNEIILLERNPLRPGKNQEGAASTFNRNQILHARNSGELFGRWMASVVLGLALVAAMWLTIFMAWQLFWINASRENDWIPLVVFSQAAIWIVLGYFSVVRFLSYLDLRIRNEGWEIELKMRAEAARLTRQAA